MLDPTIKEVGAKLLVECISENLQTELDINFDTIMSSMYEHFNFCQNKFRSSNTYSNVQQASTSHKSAAHLLLLKGKGVAFSIDTNLNEMQRYCFANLEDLPTLSQLQNFDILEFWTGKTFFLPILFIMTHDLLTRPVSTIASKSAFSTSGRILDERGSKLSLETLDSLMCLKD